MSDLTDVIRLELSPEELHILATWAGDYLKNPTDGRHHQAQKLALALMKANAQYMTAALTGADPAGHT